MGADVGLVFASALELARKLRTRECSSDELMQATRCGERRPALALA